MDNMGELEKKLINELVQGREVARQLQMCMHVPSSSQETRECLIQRIIATFEKALAMINWNGGSTVGEASQPTPVGIRMSESPPLSGSPRSEDSDRDNPDPSASRKRKCMPRWTKQIQVSPGMAVEGPLDDGYSWRKYGQKDILGAKFPRGYYRCTHRNVQGCLATKQVQRSDEDPTIFEITYRGKHTCAQGSSAARPSGTQENQKPHPNTRDAHQHQSQEELLSNLRAGLRVETENLDVPEAGQSLASFLFASTSSNMNNESQVLTSPVMENYFAENFGSDPSYMSPAASGVSYFSVSPSGVNNNILGGHPNLAPAASEISGVISAVTSAANSPAVGLDPPFVQFGLEGHNFTFDNPPFF